jgi:hypothetical protein
MSQIDEKTPHRLFAAIVLMGGGLAVGCGGVVESSHQVGAAGRPDVNSGGSGSVANPGEPANGGGAISLGGATSTSGSSNVGGLLVNSAGAPAEPEPVEPGPFKCPPQQWNCPASNCDYAGRGWALPDSCDCDPARPLGPSDCALGEVFICETATTTADGRALTKPIALSCRCVTKTGDCGSECATTYGQGNLTCVGSPDGLSGSCGCAIVYLK